MKNLEKLEQVFTLEELTRCVTEIKANLCELEERVASMSELLSCLKKRSDDKQKKEIDVRTKLFDISKSE